MGNVVPWWTAECSLASSNNRDLARAASAAEARAPVRHSATIRSCDDVSVIHVSQFRCCRADVALDDLFAEQHFQVARCEQLVRIEVTLESAHQLDPGAMHVPEQVHVSMDLLAK